MWNNTEDSTHAIEEHYRQALLDAADELETRLGNDGKCSWCDDMDRKQLCFYHNLIQEMKKSAGVK